ncbi:MAG: hypothetical protein U0Q18_26415 [Bryobacteraceae bacterium]
MGETTNEIVREIDQARSALEHDLATLEHRVKAETSLTVQTRKHPWIVAGFTVGCAVLVGLFVGRIIRSS